MRVFLGGVQAEKSAGRLRVLESQIGGTFSFA
jgi:hypothetical protein